MSGCSPLNSEASLYVHIPFCHKICHYCDFAKTARYATSDFGRYVSALLFQYASLDLPETLRWKSVYFGGGTPSLLGEEYAPFFEKMRDRLQKHSEQIEITIEANPLDITVSKLKVWKRLGFNRVSIGVQSLQDDELLRLTRDHNRGQALQAVEMCLSEFDNVSVDFIYGTPKLSLNKWEGQLREVVDLFPEIAHLSCYALSFESSTVFGKRLQRGLIDPAEDESIFSQYQIACQVLGESGFIHEEVSNWAKPGFEAVHNSNYWQLGFYYGLGVGAHSFVPNSSSHGRRYAVKNNVKKFLDHDLELIEDHDRDELSFWTEALFLGLRTREGVDLDKIKERVSRFERIQCVIDQLCDQFPGNLSSKGGRLRLLDPSDWYVQDAWIQKLT